MKTTIDSQIIGAVVSTLAHAVTPRVTDPSAAAALDMSLQLLNFVALGDSPHCADPFSGAADERVGEADALGGAADERGGAADWAALMYRAANEAAALTELLALKAPVSAAPQSIPLDVLQSYIRERLSGGGSARVVALIPSSGGFSKETYVVTLENAPVERLVIRRDPVAGPVERTAAEEFSILQSAFEQGVPVPEPLWADAQPPFGRSVVVTRFAGGHSAFDLTGSAIGVGESHAAVGLAAALAKVHAMRIGSATHSVGLSTHVRATLDLLEAQWRRRRIWGSEILECAFHWMKTHVPASPSEPTVVHGDASLRNFLTDADGSAALLDWELWHVGDPIEDLAYCRPDVEQVLPWPDFLAAYHANGGRAQWRADVGEYYGLWASLRNAVLCASCLHGFVHSLNRAPLAFAGIIHYRRLLLDVARRLAAFERRA